MYCCLGVRRVKGADGRTHVGAAAGLANFAVAANNDIGAEGVAGAVGCVLLLADKAAVFVLDLGAGDRGRGQDGAEDGCGFHGASNDR